MNGKQNTSLFRLASLLPRRSGQRGGFTLIETMIAVFVLFMMALLFSALIPVAARGGRQGNGYAQAALLAQHKIDQLRQGGFTKMNATQLVNMKIIDSDTSGNPVPAAAPAGLPAGTVSYSFADVDNLADDALNQGYFAAGAQGVLSLSPALSGQGGSAPTAAQAAQVTVTITWANGGQSAGTPNASVYSTHTILANY